MAQRFFKKKLSPTESIPVHTEQNVPVGIEPTETELSEILSHASDDSFLIDQEAWVLRWGIFGTICLIGVVLLIVTYRLNLSRWESEAGTQAPVIEQPSVVSIMPTSAPVLFDRSVVAVEVVNASGVAGRARKIVDMLIKQGYQDGGVETASVQETTQVYISEDVQAHTMAIQQDILHNASISGVVNVYVGKSHAVKIILGMK